MPKRKYSEEIKAECMAALLKGQGLGTVSKQYDIPKSTIYKWKIKAQQVEPIEKEPGKIERRESRIAILIGEYLEASLTTLKAQAEAFGDTDWLREQSASEVGVLHGIMLDKAVRILDAIERAGQQEDEREAVGENVVPISRAANGSN